MGLFSDNRISTVQPSSGGLYLLPGTYLLEIQRCKEDKHRAHGKAYFVAEFTIIESDNPERKPGTPVSFMVIPDKFPDLALGNIKGFLQTAAASKLLEQGVDKKAGEIVVNDAFANEMTGETNPLAGTKVRCFAFNKPTKAGTPFTHHRWFKSNESAAPVKGS
jgi:hypothetical protein